MPLIQTPSLNTLPETSLRKIRALALGRYLHETWASTSLSFVTACFLLFFYRDDAVAHVALVWFVAGMVADIFRVHSLWQFRRLNEQQPKLLFDLKVYQHWLNKVRINDFIYGIRWGVALFIFAPEDAFKSAILYTVIFCSALYKLLLSSKVEYSYIYYIVPLISITAAAILTYSPNQHIAVGYFILLGLGIYIGRFLLLRHNSEYHKSILLNHENEQLLEQIKTSEQNKNIFFASASHDLRQPLQALQLYVDILKTQPDKLPTFIDYIQQSTNEIRSLMDNLLDISKLQANIIEANPKSFEVQMLFDSLHKSYQQDAASKKVSLHFRPTSTRVNSDYQLLYRVLSNLISNSIKHTREGQGIVVAARHSHGEDIAIEVWDSGSGISKEEQSLIFSALYQASSIEYTKNNGLGLGLNIVKHILNLLKHPFELKSKRNQGTMFRFHVPKSPDQTSTASHLGLVDKTQLKGAKVLIIEDETQVLRALKQAIASTGADVTCAKSINQYQQLALQMPRPSIVICDFSLKSQITGDQLIKQIRENYNEDLPAIILTGETQASELNDFAQSPINAIIHKPIDMEELFRCMSDLLHSPE